MFWIIILHKSVVWQGLVDERKQRRLQDATAQFGIHDAIEDAYVGRTMLADSRPNVNFKRMLRLQLSFCWLANLSVACAPVLLQRD